MHSGSSASPAEVARQFGRANPNTIDVQTRSGLFRWAAIEHSLTGVALRSLEPTTLK